VEGLAGAVWGVLTATGGTLSLTFIVAIFLGIAALTLLFLGSAVVALEQFARVSMSWRNRIGFGLLWSGIAAGGYLYQFHPELSAQPWTEWLRSWLVATGAATGFVFVATLSIWVLLQRVRPKHLAIGNIAALGIGYSLVVGGSDSVGYSVSPLLLTAAIVIWVGLRRRRRRDPDRPVSGEGERLLRILCAALVPGFVIAMLLS